MKKIIIVLFVSNLSLAACNHDKTTTETHTNATSTNGGTDQAIAGEADYEAEYRDRAARMSSRMASDMKFDQDTESRVRDVYYNRARRQEELKQKYQYSAEGTNQAGDNAALIDSAGMIREMEAIEVEVDKEFRSFLKPEQYKVYETNRSTYWSEDINQDNTVKDNTQREVTVDGDEINVQTGDIKVKAEPGKSKVETDTYESEIEGNERKFKSKINDTKIKWEPGKTKYESEDTKIKIKQKE